MYSISDKNWWNHFWPTMEVTKSDGRRAYPGPSFSTSLIRGDSN